MRSALAGFPRAGYRTLGCPAEQVVSRLRDLLGPGFTGFSFLLSGPGRTAAMQQIAEDVFPLLRSAS